MKVELRLKFELRATHSLGVRQEPHEHLWLIRAEIAGEPVGGMILNLPAVRDAFAPFVDELKEKYLNTAPELSLDAQAAPTCETLAAHFFTRFAETLDTKFHAENPTVILNAVEVELYDPDGFEWGSAKLSR
ncbi:MAG: 6-carboxytetrahydropterin synthase [Rhizobacter sp.]|nr:6-carboxytetrahydropterin synthase [Chlorobiales bacterium]